jgi:hypothetical protein
MIKSKVCSRLKAQLTKFALDLSEGLRVPCVNSSTRYSTASNPARK